MGTACKCDAPPKVLGVWRVCPGCHRWENVRTGVVHEGHDFREVRPGD